jgi:hypothetical protein
VRPDGVNGAAGQAAGGLAVAGLGVLLLLDALGTLELSFGWLLPALLATVGVILVGRGLER